MLGSAVNFIDGVTNYIINDRFNQPRLWAQTPFYYISLESVDGLYGADIDYETHPIPNAIGEMSGDIFRRGKTITLTGIVRGKSFGRLEAGAEYLRQMFANTARRHLRWTRVQDSVQVYLIGRVNQDITITETLTGFVPQYQWTVGIRCDDPRTRRVSDDTIWPTWQA